MGIPSLGGTVSPAPVVADRFVGGNTSSVANTQNAIAAQTPTAVTKSPKPPTVAEVNKAVQDINKSIQSIAQNLEFSVDTDTKEVIVKVIDQQTKQVLRQIPTVEALDIAKSLDRLQGLLIKQQA